MTSENIENILIRLHVDQREVLFIILDKDGLINRKGDGTPDCNENDLYIGIDKEGLFNQLRPYITEDMNEFLQKSYDAPNKKGRTCDLKILLAGNGIETGTQFLYGELSQGPPKLFVDLCIKAVTVTEKWFQEQKKMTSAAKGNNAPKQEKKPWWKFW